MSFVLPLALAAVLLAPARLFAWGCEGHQVVAYIAERELNPTALGNVNALLTDFPIDPTLHRFCGASFAAASPMGDAATWADDVRDSRGNGEWHFVDVPLASAGQDPTQFCGSQGCVLVAIQEQLAILRAPGPNSAAKADALRYIIHFTGDVHQPLHAATDNDRGGNCDPLTFNRKPHLSRGAYSPELHGIWDTDLVEELQDRSDVEGPEALAQLLDSEITADQRSQWTASQPNDWAIESTKAAVSTAYSGLTKANGSAATAADFANSEVNNSCDLGREKAIVAMGITANDQYRSAAEAVIEERLKRAGIRLAKLLNDTWPDSETLSEHRALHSAAHQ